MSDATPDTPPAIDPREPVGQLTLQPPCPYEVDVLLYGGHPMPTRRYPDGSHGAILTADEIAVWEHLKAVRGWCGVAADLGMKAYAAGAQMCRETMARFVEQGGDATTAASIRANWNPEWGPDPGPMDPATYAAQTVGAFDVGGPPPTPPVPKKPRKPKAKTR